MEIFRFLERESKALDRRLLILGVIAGMLNMFIIFTLTVAAGKAAQSESNLWELAMVVLALGAFWLSEGTLMRHMTVIVEEIVEKVRMRIVVEFEITYPHSKHQRYDAWVERISHEFIPALPDNGQYDR